MMLQTVSFYPTACMLVVVKFFFVYIRGLNELVSVIRNPCCVCKENRLHSLHCLADYNLDLIGQVSFHLSPLKVMLKCYFLNLLKRLSISQTLLFDVLVVVPLSISHPWRGEFLNISFSSSDRINRYIWDAHQFSN